MWIVKEIRNVSDGGYHQVSQDTLPEAFDLLKWWRLARFDTFVVPNSVAERDMKYPYRNRIGPILGGGVDDLWGYRFIHPQTRKVALLWVMKSEDNRDRATMKDLITEKISDDSKIKYAFHSLPQDVQSSTKWYDASLEDFVFKEEHQDQDEGHDEGQKGESKEAEESVYNPNEGEPSTNHPHEESESFVLPPTNAIENPHKNDYHTAVDTSTATPQSRARNFKIFVKEDPPGEETLHEAFNTIPEATAALRTLRLKYFPSYIIPRHPSRGLYFRHANRCAWFEETGKWGYMFMVPGTHIVKSMWIHHTPPVITELSTNRPYWPGDDRTELLEDTVRDAFEEDWNLFLSKEDETEIHYDPKIRDDYPDDVEGTWNAGLQEFVFCNAEGVSVDAEGDEVPS
ncbi:hypothetical protein Q7P37_001909 [Cladosporium fusiforme]